MKTHIVERLAYPRFKKTSIRRILFCGWILLSRRYNFFLMVFPFVLLLHKVRWEMFLMRSKLLDWNNAKQNKTHSGLDLVLPRSGHFWFGASCVMHECQFQGSVVLPAFMEFGWPTSLDSKTNVHTAIMLILVQIALRGVIQYSYYMGWRVMASYPTGYGHSPI